MKPLMSKAVTLTEGDFKNIYREPIMLIMLLAPGLLILVMKFLVPFLSHILLERTGFDLIIYNLYIETFFMVISALMLGMITGFIILDERDDEILLYYSVTPLSKKGYLLYRLGGSILSIALVVEVIACIAGMKGWNLIKTIPVSFLAATEGPLIALFLVVFAKNKVEGLAMAKMAGFIMLAPFAILIPSQWHFAAGVFPPFWITKIYMEIVSQGSCYWIYIAAGVFIHSLWLWFFLRRFINKVY